MQCNLMRLQRGIHHYDCVEINVCSHKANINKFTLKHINHIVCEASLAQKKINVNRSVPYM